MSQDLKPNCMNCRHGKLDLPTGNVHCLHPQRPAEMRVVVRWFAGCPQHQNQENR